MSSDGVIVVAGEALVDLVVAPDGGLGAHPGGGPFNTARTLSRLEHARTCRRAGASPPRLEELRS